MAPRQSRRNRRQQAQQPQQQQPNQPPNRSRRPIPAKVAVVVCMILVFVVCYMLFQGITSDAADEEQGEVYENFHQNYRAMTGLKVFIYPARTSRTFDLSLKKLTGKYASEGYFFQNIRESRFRTEDPDQAHLFFIPISCQRMAGKGYSFENMTTVVQEYVESLIAMYPYWNRTSGADHFFVTCHSVGIRATERIPLLAKNLIRVVCSTDDVGFIPHKDIALPRVRQPFSGPAAGKSYKNRTILGFWAGPTNSKTRDTLARLWRSDSELDISSHSIHRASEYQRRLYRAKYCICPGGPQISMAQIADAIHYGCIPVILSDHYVLPFHDIMDWRKFALVLQENDVYQLKKILKGIPESKYIYLHHNLLKIQKNFQWNTPPVEYDAFHMIMYELWLRHRMLKY